MKALSPEVVTMRTVPPLVVELQARLQTNRQRRAVTGALEA